MYPGYSHGPVSQTQPGPGYGSGYTCLPHASHVSPHVSQHNNHYQMQYPAAGKPFYLTPFTIFCGTPLGNNLLTS